MPKRSVLTVDDEPLISRLVQVNLERAGYAVSSAPNGIEALEALRSSPERPDMILCDVTMPYMDGFELLRHLKADPELKDIPVVMLTARSRDADILQGQIEGAVQYLTKPLNPVDLLAVVRQVIGDPEKPE